MMNLKYYLFIMAALFTFWGCNSDDDNGIDEEVTSVIKDNSQFAMRNYSHSGCKSAYNAPKRVTSLIDPHYNNDEYIEYEGREGGYLSINHANTIFSCGLEKIGANISVEGNEILITEEMTEGLWARCICPFDVMIDAGPLMDGDYTVVIEKEGVRYAKATISFSPTANGKVNLEMIPY